MRQQEQTLSWLGVLVWAVCALFFTYEFLLRTVLGTFQHPIMYDLHLTPMAFAMLSTSAYMMVYAIMQIPVGLLSDRFGLKKTLLFAAVICAISVFGFSATYQFKTAIGFRMLMGLGSSFGFICLLMAVYDWMPKRYFAMFIGISQFVGTMGPILAAGPLHTIASKGNMPWRQVFVGLGMVGVVITALVFLFVKNNKQSLDKFLVINRAVPITHSLRRLLTQKQTWLIALYSALVYFALEYLSENEGKRFIEMHGYSSGFASYMLTLGWVGYALGCPLMGYLSDTFKRRKIIMTWSAVICFIALVIIIYLPISKFMVCLGFIMLGAGAGGQSLGFAIMAEQCGKEYVAAGMGLNNAMIALVCSVNAPIIGLILDWHSKSSALTVYNYQFAFGFIVLLAAIAVVLCLIFIDETYCRPTKEFTVINNPN